MEEFIDNVKILINALGYKVLEPFASVQSPTTLIDDEILFLSTGTASAIGRVTVEGFVVLKGSTINSKMTRSLSRGLQALRKKYIENGIIKELTITEDVLFSSSSAAADFILGHSVSGPQTWKTKDGRMLKEIEDNQTKVKQ